MKHFLSVFLLLISSSVFSADNPVVEMDTSAGKIIIELFPEQSPETVANFLAYVESDGFKKTTFHRVINDFMIQGGGFKESGQRAPSSAPIKNESLNGLSNKRGTIAMARTEEPHSATRQFFINHKDNGFLDANGGKYGYAVFGKVSLGMDVVDKIAVVDTGIADRPLRMVIINSVSLINTEPNKAE
ncbi:peptidylprolyl isomerase [Psychromonas aquimarina]|uniref:peptidylprolyl isomerase n=1 Tax=Psychromonas aquimarina TaxID=444919 RepID=UPI000414DFF3|nr:peptidylprolyl isomerase [Psychromonas aquimarina]